MTDRPIIFSPPMVLALLAGTKTQTRRLVKGEALRWLEQDRFTPEFVADPGNAGLLPYAVGDRLWVREAWATFPGGCAGGDAWYRAGHEECRTSGPMVDVRWRSPIHMPRWASRLTLLVTDVRVQRLQEISAEDAAAEGAGHEAGLTGGQAREAFGLLWDSIHGPRAWDANPWVVALTFTVERRNIDEAA